MVFECAQVTIGGSSQHLMGRVVDPVADSHQDTLRVSLEDPSKIKPEAVKGRISQHMPVETTAVLAPNVASSPRVTAPPTVPEANHGGYKDIGLTDDQLDHVLEPMRGFSLEKVSTVSNGISISKGM